MQTEVKRELLLMILFITGLDFFFSIGSSASDVWMN